MDNLDFILIKSSRDFKQGYVTIKKKLFILLNWKEKDTSLMVQLLGILLAVQRMRIQSLVGELGSPMPQSN